MLHVFDTNSIRVLGNYYPEQFPTFWAHFESAVEDGSVVSVREVYRELETQITQQWFKEWLKANKEMFKTPTPNETLFVADIFQVRHFQVLVGEQQRLKGQPVADPFVIASAQVLGGTVVTEEGIKPNAARIPNICEFFDVSYTNVQGFLKERGWSF